MQKEDTSGQSQNKHGQRHVTKFVNLHPFTYFDMLTILNVNISQRAYDVGYMHATKSVRKNQQK